MLMKFLYEVSKLLNSESVNALRRDFELEKKSLVLSNSLWVFSLCFQHFPLIFQGKTRDFHLLDDFWLARIHFNYSREIESVV